MKRRCGQPGAIILLSVMIACGTAVHATDLTAVQIARAIGEESPRSTPPTKSTLPARKAAPAPQPPVTESEQQAAPAPKEKEQKKSSKTAIWIGVGVAALLAALGGGGGGGGGAVISHMPGGGN